MFVSKDEFSDDVDSLIAHIKFEEHKDEFFKQLYRTCQSSNALHAMIEQHLDDVIKPSHLSSKEFNYRSSIVSIYGYLESYLEKLAEEYITKIDEASIPVNALPDAIRERHLELSMQLISKFQRDRSQTEEYRRSCEKSIIGNLHSFLQEDSDYSLNSKAFSVHTANFRYELIQNFFGQLGVDRIGQRALGFQAVKDLLADRQQQDTLDDIETLKSWLELELGDLAQLRNEIAHGAFERTIESPDLVIERAEFIKSFGISIADILHREFKEIVFHAEERHILGKADNTFPEHNCLGFKGKKIGGTDKELEEFTLKVGDQLYAYVDSQTNRIIQGQVVSLICNKEEVEEVQIPSALDFAIKVDFEVTNGMTNREISIPKSAVEPE